MSVTVLLKNYQCCFIYGESGVGKTYILKKIAAETENSLYITSEDFVENMCRSLRNKTMDSFRKKYLDCDVLLMDDIQYLIRKEVSLQELCLLLDDMMALGKHFIFAGNCSIDEIGDQFRDKMLYCPVIIISPPSIERRKLCLKNWGCEHKCIIEDDALQNLANLESNLFCLRGILNSVVSYHIGQHNRTVTMDDVERWKKENEKRIESDKEKGNNIFKKWLKIFFPFDMGRKGEKYEKN